MTGFLIESEEKAKSFVSWYDETYKLIEEGTKDLKYDGKTILLTAGTDPRGILGAPVYYVMMPTRDITPSLELLKIDLYYDKNMPTFPASDSFGVADTEYMLENYRKGNFDNIIFMMPVDGMVTESNLKDFQELEKLFGDKVKVYGTSAFLWPSPYQLPFLVKHVQEKNPGSLSDLNMYEIHKKVTNEFFGNNFTDQEIKDTLDGWFMGYRE